MGFLWINSARWGISKVLQWTSFLLLPYIVRPEEKTSHPLSLGVRSLSLWRIYSTAHLLVRLLRAPCRLDEENQAVRSVHVHSVTNVHVSLIYLRSVSGTWGYIPFCRHPLKGLTEHCGVGGGGYSFTLIHTNVEVGALGV